MNSLKVCWLSAGVSSFVAGWLERQSIDSFLYIDVADQHPDSMRFIRDCESALGKEVKILRSTEYEDVEDVCRREGVISLAGGYSPCTALLKKAVRRQWEFTTFSKYNFDVEITYVWGMDANEKHRADRLVDGMYEFRHQFPLIDRGITKQEAHGICSVLGIKRPLMYDLGYNNNNCIGCLKGGMGYWNKIRLDFPEVFAKRSIIERDIGYSILKDCYLDELDPNRGRMSDEISQDCNIFCMLNL